MESWRLILSGHNSPSVNMSIDEAISESFESGQGQRTLRIYGWRPAGISLGYFQKAAEILDLDECRRVGLSYVRRTTGGEAILHGSDVSYSLVTDTAFLGEKNVKDSFKAITLFVLDAYKEMGIDARYFRDDEASVSRDSSFCFAKRHVFDISASGKKLGGNAQKRGRDMIFQHGSIPLVLDRELIKKVFREDIVDMEARMTSISELKGPDVSWEDVSARLVDSFSQIFGVRLVNVGLTRDEAERAYVLRREKYDSSLWNDWKTGERDYARI